MSLSPDHYIEKISYEAFEKIVQRYPSVVPGNLASLDEARYISIPSELEARKIEDDARLHKPELIELVEWKL